VRRAQWDVEQDPRQILTDRPRAPPTLGTKAMGKRGMSEDKATANAPAISPGAPADNMRQHKKLAAVAAPAATHSTSYKEEAEEEEDASLACAAMQGESAPKKRRKVNHGMTRPPNICCPTAPPGSKGDLLRRLHRNNPTARRLCLSFPGPPSLLRRDWDKVLLISAIRVPTACIYCRRSVSLPCPYQQPTIGPIGCAKRISIV